MPNSEFIRNGEAMASLKQAEANIALGKYEKSERYRTQNRVEERFDRYADRIQNSEVIQRETKNLRLAKGIIGLSLAFTVSLGGTHIGQVVTTVFNNLFKSPELEQTTDPTKITYVIGDVSLTYDQMKEYYENEAKAVAEDQIVKRAIEENIITQEDIDQMAKRHLGNVENSSMKM